MIHKPHRWLYSLNGLEYPDLWRGVAFAAPFLQMSSAGKVTLLDARGGPLNGANLTANGTQWRGTPYGLGLGNSNAAELRRLLQTGFSPIVTSDGAGTGDFTVMQLCNPTANALGTAQVGLAQRVGTGALNQFQLAFDSNNAFGYSAGSTMFGTYATAASAVAATGLIDGLPHVWIGSRSGTVLSLYRDGVLAASASLTVRDILISGQAFCIGGVPHDAGYGLAVGATIGISIGWDRALSDAEMRLLARDPFCMFRSMPEWRGVWTPLGGAYFLNADPASFGITGAPASAVTGRMVAADAGAYAVTGFNSAIPVGRVIAANPGAYAITGIPAGVIVDRVIDAAPASFSITGIAAGILAGRALSAAPGALVITGAAADLVYTVTGAYSLNADPGVFSVTGATAGTIAGRVIDALAGGYAVTGLSASIVAGRALSADPAAYTITGATAGVLAGRVIAAEPGVYTVTGANAAAITARLLAADPGAYVITGLAATFTTGLGVQTYAAQILIMSDAREIIIIDDAREIVVN